MFRGGRRATLGIAPAVSSAVASLNSAVSPYLSGVASRGIKIAKQIGSAQVYGLRIIIHRHGGSAAESKTEANGSLREARP